MRIRETTHARLQKFARRRRMTIIDAIDVAAAAIDLLTPDQLERIIAGEMPAEAPTTKPKRRSA